MRVHGGRCHVRMQDTATCVHYRGKGTAPSNLFPIRARDDVQGCVLLDIAQAAPEEQGLAALECAAGDLPEQAAEHLHHQSTRVLR